VLTCSLAISHPVEIPEYRSLSWYYVKSAFYLQFNDFRYLL